MPLPTDRQPEEAKQKAPMDKDFPVKGLDENWAYKAQPEGTTPSCLNVRPYDATGQRLRGGQRAGLAKWIATQPNGANPIQRMGYLPPQSVGVASQTSDVPAAFGTSFPQADGPLSDSSLTPTFVASGSAIVAGNIPVASHSIVGSSFSPGSSATAGAFLTAPNTGGSFSMSAKVSFNVPSHPASGVQPEAAFSFFWDAAPALPGTVLSIESNTANMGIRISAAGPSAGFDIGFPFLNSQPMTGSGNYLDPAWWTTPRKVTVNYSNQSPFGKVSLYIEGQSSPILQINAPGGAGWSQASGARMGFWNSVGGPTGFTPTTTMTDFTVTYADIPGGGPNSYPGASIGSDGSLQYTQTNSNGLLLAVSGGSVYSGYTGNPWLAISGGQNVLSTHLNVVRTAVDFGRVYFVDGTSTGYQIYDPVSNTVFPWVATLPGLLPTNTSTPPALGTEGATMIARWRGRIVLSGLASDPQNWFMSAAAPPAPDQDPNHGPLDWDYGETPFLGTSPVAGNNSNAGLLGDVVTAIAPFNDDILMMGGVQSIWLMRGDPAENGRIDNISQEVGIIGPDAWCIDSQGTMYFFGGGAFYRLSPPGPSTLYQKTLGGMPESLSSGRLDKIFGKVDATTHEVLLLWDELLYGVHIYLTPLDNSPTVHYWWDRRTDSFWPEAYPANCDPTSVLNFKAANSTARADLLGGFDGYVRYVSGTAITDDGAPIQSRVKLAPMTPGSTHQNSRLNRITTVLDSISDPVTVNIYAAQSPEEVVNATTPAWAYTASPVNRYGVPRIQGNSILLEVANNAFKNIWVTATSYAVGATVVGPDSLLYVCLIVHTSGVFADDLAAGDWLLSEGYTWGLESLNVVSSVTGRTRHGRI